MRTAVEQGSPARGASNASCSASGRLRVASADSGGPSAGLPRKLFAWDRCVTMWCGDGCSTPRPACSKASATPIHLSANRFQALAQLQVIGSATATLLAASRCTIRASLRTRSRACLESSEARPSLHDVGWAAALTMWAATGHHGACRTVAIGMFMGCSALDRCDVCVRCAGLLVTRPRIARVRATTALMSCLAMVLHVQSTVKAQSIVEALQRHSGGGRLART